MDISQCWSTGARQQAQPPLSNGLYLFWHTTNHEWLLPFYPWTTKRGHAPHVLSKRTVVISMHCYLYTKKKTKHCQAPITHTPPQVTCSLTIVHGWICFLQPDTGRGTVGQDQTGQIGPCGDLRQQFTKGFVGGGKIVLFVLTHALVDHGTQRLVLFQTSVH